MNPFRIVIASACFLSFAVAVEPTVPPKTPTELVVLLGDMSFRTRESAAKELVAMGVAARAALEAGRKSGDAEVVARCDKLLESLSERERRTRIDRFEKAEVGSEAGDLPFWNLFRDAVGDTKASRKDFARMLRSHFSELIPLERDAEKLSGSHYQRIADFRTRQIERAPEAKPRLRDGAEADELMVMLLLGCDPRTIAHPKFNEIQFNPQIDELFRTEISDPKNGNPTMRKLFVRWTMTQTHPGLVSPALDLIRSYKIPEGYDICMKILARKKTGSLAAEALHTVGQLSNPRRTELFLEAYKDSSVFATMIWDNGTEKVTTSIQIRDVALAVLIRFDGEDLHDYNYPLWRTSRSGPNPHLYMLGFESDEQRTTARNRWQAAHIRIERLREAWLW